MAPTRNGAIRKPITPERVSMDDVAWFFSPWRGSKRDCMGTARIIHFECEARRNGFGIIAGVDEAGRGPLAGPIVAAAVVLRSPIRGLNDSKQLLHAEREALYERLYGEGHCIGVAVISETEIDQRGIQWANYAAMLRALDALAPTPDYALVDGFNIPGCVVPHQRLIKGDARSQSIAAASVIAKVTRDRMMVDYDRMFPGYGFAQHKGYATAEHFAAIETLGPCAIHRMSFSPFARTPETGELFEEDSDAEEYLV